MLEILLTLERSPRVRLSPSSHYLLAVDGSLQGHIVFGLPLEGDLAALSLVIDRDRATAFLLDVIRDTTRLALSVLPKGVQWKKTPPDDADFISSVWALKKQSDPGTVPPATLAQFGVQYLSSPQATAELREMGAGATEETPETGEARADSSEES